MAVQMIGCACIATGTLALFYVGLAMFMWKTLADRNTPLLDATRKQFQLRQSPHNEIRKSEKDSSHKTRAECCDKRQEVDRIIHLSKSAGAFSDVVFIVRIEIPR